MITNEMKAKIFGLYIGCECVYDNSMPLSRHAGNILGYDYRYGFMISTKNAIVPFRFVSQEFTQLILTPLSEITDEDAIEVARLLDPWLVEQMAYELTREKISDKGHIITIEGMRDKSRKVRIFLPMGHVFCSDNENTINPGVIDFLRSRGYALPYMGIDLFQSNIAIQKK